MEMGINRYTIQPVLATFRIASNFVGELSSAYFVHGLAGMRQKYVKLFGDDSRWVFLRAIKPTAIRRWSFRRPQSAPYLSAKTAKPGWLTRLSVFELAPTV
jgi:hypothetical protein